MPRRKNNFYLIIAIASMLVAGCLHDDNYSCDSSDVKISEKDNQTTTIQFGNGVSVKYGNVTPFANFDFAVDSNLCLLYYNSYYDSIYVADINSGYVINSAPLLDYFNSKASSYKIRIWHEVGFVIFTNTQSLLIFNPKLTYCLNVLDHIKYEILHLDRVLEFDWTIVKRGEIAEIELQYRTSLDEKSMLQKKFNLVMDVDTLKIVENESF